MSCYNYSKTEVTDVKESTEATASTTNQQVKQEIPHEGSNSASKEQNNSEPYLQDVGEPTNKNLLNEETADEVEEVHFDDLIFVHKDGSITHMESIITFTVDN